MCSDIIDRNINIFLEEDLRTGTSEWILVINLINQRINNNIISNIILS